MFCAVCTSLSNIFLVGKFSTCPGKFMAFHKFEANLHVTQNSLPPIWASGVASFKLVSASFGNQSFSVGHKLIGYDGIG